MPVLTERTKIKTDLGCIPSTTDYTLYGCTSPALAWGGDKIDANAYVIGSGSIQIQKQQYIPVFTEKGKEALRKLYSFEKLHINWDGNNAEPPKEKIIKSAVNFLTSADEYDLPIYFTAPGPNGEIVLEYKSGKNTAEVFFEEDASEMILYTGSAMVYEGNVDLDYLISHLKA